jgi:uncharacterized membrane-anchored protein
MKALPLIIFGLAAAAQWAVPLLQIQTHEQTLTQGRLIKLKCLAPDPYDPLRGRYLAVRPEQQSVEAREDMKLERGMPVFAQLTTGEDGLAIITSLTLSAPTSGDFIRVKTGYTYQGKVHIEWPFERFYINEKLAPEADKWFAENIRTAQGIIAEVRVRNGNAVLADLSLGWNLRVPEAAL